MATSTTRSWGIRTVDIVRTSRLTILGFSIMTWSGIVAIVAVAQDGTRFEHPLSILAILGATGGLATAIVGAARHNSV